MHLIPTEDEVVQVLRQTGALRDGHFEYPSGLHSNQYLQVPLALRHSANLRMLSVGLSRKLRANPEIRAVASDLSLVAPMTGGLPVAYGMCEAMRARQVYWSEREHDSQPWRFRPFLEPLRGEPVILVDDVLRSGTTAAGLKRLLESFGATVLGLAVVVYQPTPEIRVADGLPLYYLARLEASYAVDSAHCQWCQRGIPLEKVWV